MKIGHRCIKFMADLTISVVFIFLLFHLFWPRDFVYIVLNIEILSPMFLSLFCKQICAEIFWVENASKKLRFKPRH